MDLASDNGASEKAVNDIIKKITLLEKGLPTDTSGLDLMATINKEDTESELYKQRLALRKAYEVRHEEYETVNLELRKILNHGLATELMTDILARKVPIWFMSGGRMLVPDNPGLLIGKLCPFITEELGNQWLKNKSYNLVWIPRLSGASDQEIKDQHLYDTCRQMGMTIPTNPYSPLKGIASFARKLGLPRKTLSDAINRHRKKIGNFFS